MKTFISLKVIILLVLSGCSNQGYSIIATTGTTIGLGISQQPTNGSIDATFGYKRAEVAFVPTNRANNDIGVKNSFGNGATDIGDVIMELHYNGGLSTSDKTGIYQRLAIGKSAVNSVGSKALFTKDSSGELQPDIIHEFQNYEVNLDISNQLVSISKIYNEAKDKNENETQMAINEAAKTVGYGSYGDMAISNNVTADEVIAIKVILNSNTYLKGKNYQF